MTCLSCQSANQVELTAEMVIHFPRHKPLGKPGVWLFPKLEVCLECGFSRFTIPDAKLASVAKCTEEIRTTDYRGSESFSVRPATTSGPES
jgi:hypothetical protein